METHNWIWKAVRANKSETVKAAAKTIARLSRELIAESVQVAAVAGKIVDSIDGSQKRGSHCDSCVADFDECPCNTCARNNPGAVTAGDFGVAVAGNRSAAAARGWAAVGAEGIACARGNDVKVKGGLGSILVLVEEKTDSWKIDDWKVVEVDGEVIKPDTWYELKNGEVVEVKGAAK